MVVPEQELEQPAAQPADAVVEDEVRSSGRDGRLRFRDRHALILMNMFTKNVKPRRRGRPPGQTPRGAAAKDRLYATAIRMITERGYEATTLREIAREADDSVGLI
jgi:hypothetical protein